MVEMEVGRESLKDEETTVDIESEIPVYCRKQKINLLTLAVSKKDTYRIKEAVTLPRDEGKYRSDSAYGHQQQKAGYTTGRG